LMSQHGLSFFLITVGFPIAHGQRLFRNTRPFHSCWITQCGNSRSIGNKKNKLVRRRTVNDR
jgi:hypothetical protein